MKKSLPLLALVAALPAFAEEQRQLDAHEHGVGTLNIAIDGNSVAMEFHAPGADIVGFEYAAVREEDHAAIEAALVTLGTPLELFVMPDAAGCSVAHAMAELESEDDHDDHHEEGHEDHSEEDHDDHMEEGHDDHAEEHHDEHEHDDDGDKDHDDAHHDDGDHDDHADHADEAGHTEFHADFLLTCNAPQSLTTIAFAYFDTFPNAKEVEVQVITDTGAQAFEVERDAPVLDLGR